MLDLERLEWDAEALALAGISAAQLPALVPTTTVVGVLRGGGAVPVVVGAGDGPLANLGVGGGATGGGGVLDRDQRGGAGGRGPAGGGEAGRLFCYALTEERWLSGGAINNGGVVLRWLGSAFELGDHPEAARCRCRLGPRRERRPGDAAPALRGAGTAVERLGAGRVSRPHPPARAAASGAGGARGGVPADGGGAESVRAGGAEVCEVRATGGFARSPLWRQMLTDALGMEVRFPEGVEGSSRGAALLAMVGLGLVAGLDEAGDGVSIAEVLGPDPRAAEVYAELRGVVEEAHGVLAGVMGRLRTLDIAPAAAGGSRVEALTAEVDLG